MLNFARRLLDRLYRLYQRAQPTWLALIPLIGLVDSLWRLAAQGKRFRDLDFFS